LLPDDGYYVGGCSEDHRQDGNGVAYHADGQAAASGYWFNGQLHDLAVTWDEHGKMIECGWFAHGRLIDERPVPRRRLPAKRINNCQSLRAFRCSDCGDWGVQRSRTLSSAQLSSLPLCFVVMSLTSADGGGDLLLPGGGRYVGQLNECDDQHGQGVEFKADGSESASGQWRAGKLHGQGATARDGIRYEGNFVEGQMSGLGRFTWPAGGVYEGEFKECDFSGFGVEWTAADKVVRSGRWTNDKLVESCPVPRSKIPIGKFLSAAGESAILRDLHFASGICPSSSDCGLRIVTAIADSSLASLCRAVCVCDQPSSPRFCFPTAASTAARSTRSFSVTARAACTRPTGER
jgi:hypothetical protein